MDDLEGFEKLLEFSQKTFKCLRSGECCSGFEVHGVPGYNQRGEWTGNLEEKGRKPSQNRCRHLQPAQIVAGKWKPAVCAIHDSEIYPSECKQFTFGFGPCALGAAIWKHRKDENPEAELTPDAAEAMKIFYKKEVL